MAQQRSSSNAVSGDIEAAAATQDNEDPIASKVDTVKVSSVESVDCVDSEIGIDDIAPI